MGPPSAAPPPEGRLTCVVHLRADVAVGCFDLPVVGDVELQNVQLFGCSCSQLLSSSSVNIQHTSEHQHPRLTEPPRQLLSKARITTLVQTKQGVGDNSTQTGFGR